MTTSCNKSYFMLAWQIRCVNIGITFLRNRKFPTMLLQHLVEFWLAVTNTKRVLQAVWWILENNNKTLSINMPYSQIRFEGFLIASWYRKCFLLQLHISNSRKWIHLVLVAWLCRKLITVYNNFMFTLLLVKILYFYLCRFGREAF